MVLGRPLSRASSLAYWNCLGPQFVSDDNPLWERACSRRGLLCRRRSHSSKTDTAYNCARTSRLVLAEATFYRLPVATQSRIPASMNTTPARKPAKQKVRDELTFLDVRQAARDGQKGFDTFVITGWLPITGKSKRSPPSAAPARSL